MTDGEDHEGDPVAAAQALHDQGVRVFVVGIGSKTGEPIPTYAPDGTWTGYLRDEKGSPILSALTDQNEAQLRQHRRRWARASIFEPAKARWGWTKSGHSCAA